MNVSTKHLDLGCGLNPFNPYSQDLLYGCDIRDIGDELINFNYEKVNLVVAKIPFPDHFFDSISAMDFLEHIPRQIVLPNGEMCNPFVNLMSEIHRVLKPGGLFFALTPCYPHPSAFVDPTHVNVITEDTYSYFIGDNPIASMYGFTGRFGVKRVFWEMPKNVKQASVSKFRKWYRRFQQVWFRDGLSHQCWEFVAR
ncbi:class I SAM-dependent methyltransferase [Ferribacterium limneticum]|uniref:class I SAM-dependent methyltransferase n=1 Tax=Ferribacterium limneticum TaxID=76259 RepID=UPI001CF93CC8|nr:class I SAM-dependent methyltransferase [Ferribacterium limneticum]UCV19177.1 class I SAM-dependent methyltransferase [Ferribacterium limneticum]